MERVWQEMKDEVEKDEADAKAVKKKMAGESRVANKAKRNESTGSAKHQMLLLNEDEADLVRTLLPDLRLRGHLHLLHHIYH